MNKNLKMLFISSFDSTIKDFNGVSKKLWIEICTFRKFGYKVDFIEINNQGVFLTTEDSREKIISWLGSYHKTYIGFYSKFDRLNYDIVYFRYEHISWSMLKFISNFKRSGKKLVIGELPTYMSKPYKTSSIRTKLSFYFKKVINAIVPKKIDFLVTFSEHTHLYGVKTINIENFTDVSNLRIKSYQLRNDKICNLLVLAQLTPAHGVDLLIRGLAEFKKKHNDIDCRLHIVGEGAILDLLKQLVIDLELVKDVVFYGSLGGDSLDEIFDACDIGVGALAIYRKGSFKLSELKIREYTARGLPFMYNAYEPQIENEFFGLKIDFSDKSINFSEIIDFYKNFEYSDESARKMRGFAVNNFTPESQLLVVDNKIVDYFNN